MGWETAIPNPENNPPVLSGELKDSGPKRADHLAHIGSATDRREGGACRKHGYFALISQCENYR